MSNSIIYFKLGQNLKHLVDLNPKYDIKNNKSALSYNFIEKYFNSDVQLFLLHRKIDIYILSNIYMCSFFT